MSGLSLIAAGLWAGGTLSIAIALVALVRVVVLFVWSVRHSSSIYQPDFDIIVAMMVCAGAGAGSMLLYAGALHVMAP